MVKSSKPEEKWYLVPEVEVRVHESWINLVVYCRDQMPFGDIKIKIVDGRPTTLLEQRPSIRFDKVQSVPAVAPEGF